mgnify:CR=1 FL=1
MFYFTYYHLTTKQSKKKEWEDKIKALKSRLDSLERGVKEGIEMTLEAQKEFGIEKKKLLNNDAQVSMDKETKRKELEEKLTSLKNRVRAWRSEIEEGIAYTIEIEKKYGLKKKEVTE